MERKKHHRRRGMGGLGGVGVGAGRGDGRRGRALRWCRSCAVSRPLGKKSGATAVSRDRSPPLASKGPAHTHQGAGAEPEPTGTLTRFGVFLDSGSFGLGGVPLRYRNLLRKDSI